MSLQSTDLKKYHSEVLKSYLAAGRPYSKKDEIYLKENMYKTTYRVYNISKENQKSLLKQKFSFSTLSEQEQAKVWSYIFLNTDYLGLGDLAISYFKSFQNKKNKSLIVYWPLLKSWISKIENWAHADMLASVYCDMLTESPSKIYPELKKWSKAKSPWKNRMAIVSLLYYYNPKRVLLPFSEIIALVKPHLKKDHYYLQKAIGWNLRELSKAYPKEYWNFLNENLYDLSSVAYTTAVEKIPKSKKDVLKIKRKESRKANKKSR